MTLFHGRNRGFAPQVYQGKEDLNVKKELTSLEKMILALTRRGWVLAEICLALKKDEGVVRVAATRIQRKLGR